MATSTSLPGRTPGFMRLNARTRQLLTTIGTRGSPGSVMKRICPTILLSVSISVLPFCGGWRRKLLRSIGASWKGIGSAVEFEGMATLWPSVITMSSCLWPLEGTMRYRWLGV